MRKLVLLLLIGCSDNPVYIKTDVVTITPTKQEVKKGYEVYKAFSDTSQGTTPITVHFKGED